MAYIVVGGNRKFRIDAELLETGELGNRYSVILDDRDYSLNISHITPTHLSILMGNRSFNVEVERKGDEYLVSTRGEVFSFRIQDERSGTIEDDSDSGGESLITAPMPGLVIKVLVKEGDVINSKDKLLILEAMKMQNDLTAPGSGTVTKVFVATGDKVMTGDELVQIESPDQSDSPAGDT